MEDTIDFAAIKEGDYVYVASVRYGSNESGYAQRVTRATPKRFQTKLYKFGRDDGRQIGGGCDYYRYHRVIRMATPEEAAQRALWDKQESDRSMFVDSDGYKLASALFGSNCELIERTARHLPIDRLQQMIAWLAELPPKEAP